MIALDGIDIKLDENGQPTVDENGEFTLITEDECFLQDVKNEAVTQEGELFYDESYGWSLLDFLNVEFDDIIKMEIEQRIKEKLSKREVIDEKTINIEVISDDNSTYKINVTFKFENSETEYNLPLELNESGVTIYD